MSAIPPHKGIRKFLAGFDYAISGLRYSLKTQCNIRVHVFIATAALIAAVGLQMSRLEIVIIVMTITVVLAAELFNTAVETLVDLVSPEFHTLAKITKDVSAAAVFVCAIGATVVGLLLFVPAIWQIITSGS